MPARYHPLFDGLWNDDAFDAQGELPAASFEERAFFAFLCSNHRLRQSGIYRVTDEQLALDSNLSVSRVRRHLLALAKRKRIVRDGFWLFVRGYLARQAQHKNLMQGAEEQVKDCASDVILSAFAERYPHLRQWSRNRRQTVAEPSPNGRATPKRKPSAEQSSTEQSNAEQYTVEQPSPVDNPGTPEPLSAPPDRTVAHATGPTGEPADEEAFERLERKRAAARALLRQAFPELKTPETPTP